MKKCSRCSVEKELSCFARQSSARDGLQNYCKQCNTIYTRNRRAANPVPHRESVKQWIKANSKKHSEYCKKWADKNKEKRREIQKAFHKRHPHKSAAKVTRRKRAQGNATPAWANRFFIEEIYHLAQLRTKATGVKHHVDHIIPLRGEFVCGLHVENNLRVIPEKESLSKGRKLVEPAQ